VRQPVVAVVEAAPGGTTGASPGTTDATAGDR
jgi:hypothetical protein